MRNIVAMVTGALMAAQASLTAKWPETPRELTLCTLSVAIGACGGYLGKSINSRIRKIERTKPT